MAKKRRKHRGAFKTRVVLVQTIGWETLMDAVRLMEQKQGNQSREVNSE